jgi:hypothetical protein
MTKRPHSTGLAEQPPTKRINIEGKHTEEYEKSNSYINSMVQTISQQSHLSEDHKLARMLSIILVEAPSEACLKNMNVAEFRDLITSNSGLKQALQRAINRQHYEDVMSLPILQKEVQQKNTSECPQSG